MPLNATGVRAEDRHQQIAASGAHQPGNSQHFAAPHRKADVIDQFLAGDHRIINRKVFDFKYNFALGVIDHRKDVADFAPDHARDDLGLGPVAGRVSADRFAVAQDRDAIADPETLRSACAKCRSSRRRAPAVC